MPGFDVRWLDGATAARRRVDARSFPLRLFSQELSVLLGAGIPLLEAIVTLKEKEPAAGAAAALDEVARALRSGSAFSESLRAQPDCFDELFVAIVASAERTGQLREALRSHAAYLHWAEQLRARLVQAAVYPVLLVVASLAVMLFLLVVVVPRFAGILDGVAADVPAASRALLAAGQWSGAHPWLAVGAVLGLAALPVLAWRQRAWRAEAERLLWRLPLVGGRLRLLALARLFRTAGMLLAAGVAAVPALRICTGVVAQRLRPALAQATDAVARGERLSAAFESAGLATPVSRRMLRVGEQSGQLAAMLAEAAAFHDEELSRFTEIITRFLNPFLMLLMGGLIGTIVVLLYLPIFQIVESVQ